MGPWYEAWLAAGDAPDDANGRTDQADQDERGDPPQGGDHGPHTEFPGRLQIVEIAPTSAEHHAAPEETGDEQDDVAEESEGVHLPACIGTEDRPVLGGASADARMGPPPAATHNEPTERRLGGLVEVGGAPTSGD